MSQIKETGSADISEKFKSQFNNWVYLASRRTSLYQDVQNDNPGYFRTIF